MTTANNHTNIRIIALSAVVLAVMISALGAWFHNAGSALAPGPAQLTAPLNGTNGATAAAIYAETAVRTSVLIWPATPVAVASPPAAGTPCSNGPLATGSLTTKVIVAPAGSYRKCM